MFNVRSGFLDLVGSLVHRPDIDGTYGRLMS